MEEFNASAKRINGEWIVLIPDGISQKLNIEKDSRLCVLINPVNRQSNSKK